MAFDISGKRYGSLVVLQPTSKHRGRSAWLCQCDCGSAVTVLTGNLRPAGGTRSCGCLQRRRTSEAATVHGLSHSPEWFHWVRMRARVQEGSPERSSYFDRGIDVDPRLQTFPGFLAEIGRKPLGPLRWTVGRIDNMLGYAPGNVEWQTYTAQARARRMPITNSSGIFGVAIRKGRYVARWYGADGKAKSRSFHTADEAVLYREKMIAELNKAGANYHPSHGKSDD